MITATPDKEYIIRLRRELHRIPEIGFDLPKTLGVIRRELDGMGIEYSEEFGKSSIVAYVARGRGEAIAFRADMDALPIKEESGVPFSSEHEGKMHACGHDAHTAMLLGAARMFKSVEDELPCEVRLFFQAGEETPPGGARLMCEDGCMDGVRAVFATHVGPTGVPGKIIFNYGVTYACSRRFTIVMHGKSAHAAAPYRGVDAIAMSHRVYSALQVLRSREVDPMKPVILNVGIISGGTAANNIPDRVEMQCSLRTLDDATGEFIINRAREICDAIATDMGGSAEVETLPYYPALVNDASLARQFKLAAIRAVGEDMVYDGREPCLGGEDFAHFAKYAPAVNFLVGARLGDKICGTHHSNMVIDEDALVNPVLVYREIINQLAFGQK